MIKLYGGKRSRAAIAQWYLEELQVPYEFITLDMENGEHRKPEFLAINPMGKVPAIEDNGFYLWESGAILSYLSDQYAKEQSTPQKRAEINQWILFANATLGPGIFIESSRETEKSKLFPPLNDHLSKHDYLVDNQFTAADVAVGAYLAYMPMMLQLDFSDYPAIANYVKRLSERDGFKASLGSRSN
ncbi:glutathione S-transferase family protein [Euhalothece natronophila Z-M001]|uniref:Glutathione S-transferase family protein n=1 Tax=Euhalothece natronophila Z-M001 TaxID=522448 RepID=A0A5B8NNT2_9CHRO|nr:glutathione S-transferase family protein [Euhalothece natronophila]QDZ40241.1 glutathione S-transferase family protein [Euhalothece natronophila Z-M001]